MSKLRYLVVFSFLLLQAGSVTTIHIYHNDNHKLRIESLAKNLRKDGFRVNISEIDLPQETDINTIVLPYFFTDSYDLLIEYMQSLSGCEFQTHHGEYYNHRYSKNNIGLYYLAGC